MAFAYRGGGSAWHGSFQVGGKPESISAEEQYRYNRANLTGAIAYVRHARKIGDEALEQESIARVRRQIIYVREARRAGRLIPAERGLKMSSSVIYPSGKNLEGICRWQNGEYQRWEFGSEAEQAEWLNRKCGLYGTAYKDGAAVDGYEREEN